MSKYKIQTSEGVEIIELDKELEEGDKGFILGDTITKIKDNPILFKVIGRSDEVKKEEINKSYDINQINKDDEKRFVLGRVLIPERIDAEEDIMSKEEIEKAAHNFMINSHAPGVHHQKYAKDTHIVESYIAPTDFEINGETVKKGTWLVGMRVFDDELWKKIKEEKLKAYSIGGWGDRVPVQ